MRRSVPLTPINLTKQQCGRPKHGRHVNRESHGRIRQADNIFPNHTPRGATKLGAKDYNLAYKKQDCDTVAKGNPNGTKRAIVDKIMQCLSSRFGAQFVNKPGTKNIQNKLREIDLFKLAEHAQP